MADLPSHDPEAAWQRHAFWLEYNGARYQGSQFQRHGTRVLPTIEGALREAFEALHLPLQGAVSLSGRTDTGVHARGQVGHVTLPHGALARVNPLASALNARLPEDISVADVACDVGLSFHSRACARWRWYRYTLLNRRQRCATLAHDVCLERRPLNVARMNEAAGYLQGQHLFTSFQSAGSPLAGGPAGDSCRVAHAAVWQNDDLIKFDIVATRFLYRMVRNIMGLLIAIGDDSPGARNRYAPTLIREMVQSPNRSLAAMRGPCAPPNGLSLMAVSYAPDYTLFPDNPLVQHLHTTLTQESLLL